MIDSGSLANLRKAQTYLYKRNYRVWAKQLSELIAMAEQAFIDASKELEKDRHDDFLSELK